MTIRKDCWTESDDTALTRIVLKHINEGSTQLAAFEEAAGELHRTAAACGFRWNSEVRKIHETAVKDAKRNRQLRMKNKQTRTAVADKPQTIKNSASHAVVADDDYASLDMAIAVMLGFKQRIDELTKQLKEKDKQIGELTERLKESRDIVPDPASLSEDYQILLRILERARKQGLLDLEPEGRPAFKMDGNGNLELIG